MGVPALIIWGVGIPTALFYVLRKERANLRIFSVREEFGFFYLGYKKKYYYWEIIIFARKILIIVISVLLNVWGIMTQALLLLILFILFTMLNLKVKPFVHETLNHLENISHLTSMLTVYTGLFFLSDRPSIFRGDVDSSMQQYPNVLNLSEAQELGLFWVILIINFYFFGLWFYKIWDQSKAIIRIKYRRCYIFLCLCNKQRVYLYEVER